MKEKTLKLKNNLYLIGYDSYAKWISETLYKENYVYSGYVESITDDLIEKYVHKYDESEYKNYLDGFISHKFKTSKQSFNSALRALSSPKYIQIVKIDETNL